jgi:hypothetical protein
VLFHGEQDLAIMPASSGKYLCVCVYFLEREQGFLFSKYRLFKGGETTVICFYGCKMSVNF